MLIKAAVSALIIVDVQQKLVPAMSGIESVVDNCRTLMRAAEHLGVPALLSEQYPKGLGPTVETLAAIAPADMIYPKVHFSCADDPELRRRFETLERRQAVIAGIEAHVCVLQTALGLRDIGYECAVVEDAVTSRQPASKQTAIMRLRENGVDIVTTEMVIFEWMRKAGTPEFKALSALIK